MRREYFFLISIILLVLAPRTEATTYTVKASGGGSYTTISACIAAMSASGGDTCTVYAGTYSETPTLKAGATGNYNVVNTNGTDVVSVLGFTMASHSKLIGNCAAGAALGTCGFSISNTTTPYGTACIMFPQGTTDAYAEYNTMAYCGGAASTEPAMIVVGYPRNGTSPASSFIYVIGNTTTHGCSNSGVNDVCQSIGINGDHILVDSNDFSHNDDTIGYSGRWVVARGNNIHDSNSSECNTGGHGSNCHLDMFETEAEYLVGADNPITQFGLFEGNTANNFLGQAHAILAQSDACNTASAVNCFSDIIRLNSMSNVGNYNIVDDNAGNGTVLGFEYFKSYNNTWVNFGTNNGDATATFTHNSNNGSDFNDIYYYSGSVSLTPYNSSGSTGFTAGSNLAWCSAGSCSFTGRSGSGSFATDATGNLATDPKFVNYAGNNFQLQTGSPAIQAGSALTTTTNSGTSSTSLSVADPYFFQDGWGFPAGTGVGQVAADWIRIGSSTTVQISSISYSSNVITLATPVSWSSGQGVYLYKDSRGNVVLTGVNPDLGAFPSGVSPPAPPPTATVNPPTNLQAVVN